MDDLRDGQSEPLADIELHANEDYQCPICERWHETEYALDRCCP